MESRLMPLLLLFTCSPTLCSPGDPVMFLPPLEVRSVDSNSRPMFPFSNQQFAGSNVQFQPVSQDMVPMPQQRQQIFHTSSNNIHMTPTPSTTETEPIEKEPEIKHHNFTVNEFIEALNGIADHKEEEHESRAASKDYGYPSSPYQPPYHAPGPYGGPNYPHPPSYGPPSGYYGPPSSGYSSPSQGYGPPPPAYEPPTAHVPAVHHSKMVKADLDIFKPIKTKIAGKLSGLIGLVLALFSGSAPNDLELGGLKDIVINGIIKPLLIAKGGIKSLISKLAIPVISLLLINLEVLITIWWLWEECPAQEPHPAPYVYPYPNKPAY